jgi:D-alanine transaminase
MAQPPQTIYLNGEFLPIDQARVPVLDRGFLFGDGVYEVIPVYGGRPLRLSEHLRRLDRSLAAILMTSPLADDSWAEIIERLIEGPEDQQIYIQVTRGVQPKRDHAIPAEVTPTVFVMASRIAPIPSGGIKAVTVTDIRWDRCDIKAITLLSNVLLRQEAISRGAAEAVIIRDGLALEGAASNLFIVNNGEIITPPKSETILPGITRDLVLEIAAASGFKTIERTISLPELRTADEIWFTSSTREILSVTELDGQSVSGGEPGPVWKQVLAAYQDYKRQLREGKIFD